MAKHIRDLEKSMQQQLEHAIGTQLKLTYETVLDTRMVVKTAFAFISLIIPGIYTRIPQQSLSVQLLCLVCLLVFVRMVIGSPVVTRLTPASQDAYMKFILGAFDNTHE